MHLSIGTILHYSLAWLEIKSAPSTGNLLDPDLVAERNNFLYFPAACSLLVEAAGLQMAAALGREQACLPCLRS